jgi:hypothetical protein
MADLSVTRKQYLHELTFCREIFEKKLIDYGASWRVFRPSSLTDQLFIKAQRIRSIEEKGTQKVKDDIRSEFMALVNYSIMSILQLEHGSTQDTSGKNEPLLDWYNEQAERAFQLMADKNHDYDEAWRDMRISSMTDLILMKIFRTKQIENNDGVTLVSEGVEANYQDMLNYAVFCLITLKGEQQQQQQQ